MILFNYTQFSTYFSKGSDGRIQVVAIMRSRDLHTDARQSLRYYREEKPDYINTFFQQFGGKLLCQHCII
ncbi:hypothetical protein D3C73_1639890 [compost metagenome]